MFMYQINFGGVLKVGMSPGHLSENEREVNIMKKMAIRLIIPGEDLRLKMSISV